MNPGAVPQARRDCCALGAKQMDATIAKYSPPGVVLLPALLQKEIHAVEVDDRMTIVERIHPQNTADSDGALLQREMW